ncbi:hypothetical protein [uncultured Paraglaciecola sp.]|nr:hypothetical protein [uncultured Paraglaciecola sp.]
MKTDCPKRHSRVAGRKGVMADTIEIYINHAGESHIVGRCR